MAEELPGSVVAATLHHLAECSECGQRLRRLRASNEDMAQLLREIDHPMPPVSLAAVLARAAQRRRTRRRGALAAGLATLVIAGAAAAAVPGSPVRRYVERVLIGQAGPQARRASTARPSTALLGVRQTAPSGIAFVPVGDVEVRFREVQRAGTIRIRLTDATAVRITHVGGSAGYVLTAGGVSVENAGSGASYDITLPRTGAPAVVRVSDRVVFSKSDSAISTPALPDRGGSYVIAFPQLTSRRIP
jgi:hypothetical protein